MRKEIKVVSLIALSMIVAVLSAIGYIASTSRQEPFNEVKTLHVVDTVVFDLDTNIVMYK